MNRRLRILVGMMTTVVALGIGASLLLGERYGMGAFVTVLGLYRGIVLIRQVRATAAGPRVIPPGPPEGPGPR